MLKSKEQHCVYTPQRMTVLLVSNSKGRGPIFCCRESLFIQRRNMNASGNTGIAVNLRKDAKCLDLPGWILVDSSIAGEGTILTNIHVNITCNKKAQSL